MNILGILGIVGGLVLFLYGIQALGVNLKKVSGGKMEEILESLTSNKWKGALLGALVTAVIQSSGATIVMVVGFVNSEIMSLNQAVGVILGANIGTTITAWLLSTTGIQSSNLVLQLLKPANFSPIVGIIGIFMTMLSKKQKTKDIGALMTSFAVLMLGMNAMSTAAAPLATNPSFTGLLTMFSNPILGLLVGLVVTVILQSSSASIGILQAIALTGTLQMGSAIPVLMGENIGSAVTGVLGALGASKNARRASLIQMFYCIIKTVVFMVGFYTLNAMMHFPIMTETATPVSIAVFHSVFNIVAVCLMLPVSDILVKMVERAVPVTQDEKDEKESKNALQILDARFITSPSFALQQCKTAANKMAQYTKESIDLATDLVLHYTDEGAAQVDKLERLVDDYEDQLNLYLVKMSGMQFSPKDSHMFNLLMHSIGDFERMTDHALNIMQSAQGMHEKEQKFSPAAVQEVSVFNEALCDIVNRAMKAFTSSDPVAAATVEPLEEVIDGLNMEIKRRHVRRVRLGQCSVELGIVLEDITTDYERIADHCNNIAVYLRQMKNDDIEMHTYLGKLEDSDKQEFRQRAHEFERIYALPELDGADQKKKAAEAVPETDAPVEESSKDGKEEKSKKDKDKKKKKKK